MTDAAVDDVLLAGGDAEGSLDQPASAGLRDSR
jgi:hypothetical protein